MINRRSAFIRSGLCRCSLRSWRPARAAAEDDRPPPQVGFVVVQPVAVPVSVTLGGRTVAYETSEVRPQINGLIRRRLFTEGSVVRAGQPLYQIDASLYRAAVNQAEANLASARASAEAAVARADRYKPLAEMEAVAAAGLHRRRGAGARQPRAGIAQNAAALETARINLRFTTVPAPISGRIGRSLSTVGALVSANQADPLAVIQRLDPIYVDIQQSSAELTALRQALQRGEIAAGSTSVRLTLEDGSDYGYAGTVAVLRSHGRREHRHGHPARALPQPAAACCCRACSCRRCSTRRSSRARSWSRSRRCSAISTARPSSIVVGPDNKADAPQGHRRAHQRHQLGGDRGPQAGRPGDHPGPRQQRQARQRRSGRCRPARRNASPPPGQDGAQRSGSGKSR